MMLTKNKNPKVSYYSRLLVLPLAAIVFFAFTLKVNSNSTNSYNGKTIIVVIDAGHGGNDNGALSANGLKEKDITLSIAKKVVALNSNDHFRILLSRDKDQTISVRNRVHFAQDHSADLFVSIHVNGSTDQQLNGFSVLIDRHNTEKNQVLASALINELKSLYKTDNEIEVQNRGLFVVDSNSCPAALVECGYLSNANDVAFISKDANQEKIAKDILNAINNYADSKKVDDTKSAVINKSDTIPSQTLTGAVYVDGKNKIFLRADKLINTTNPEKTKVNIMKAVIVINGKIEPNSILKTKTIHAGILTIHSGTEKDMQAKYGEKAKNGVFILDNATIKNEKPVFPQKGKSSGGTGIVFTKVNVDAQFPGGPIAWQKYIVRKVQASLDSFTNADYGTCVVRFIVDVDGRVSDVQATTMKGTLLAKISVDAIRKGPKWIPAKQNGHDVASYRLQPVTLSSPDKLKKVPDENTRIKWIRPRNQKEDGNVFIKLDQTASFPGGQTAWLKYNSRVITKNGNEL